MGLSIGFDGLWEESTRSRIENVLQTCVGDPPLGEEWTILVTCFVDFCVVRVTTLQQTRRKVFLSRPSDLADLIPNWLEQYPLQ